MRRLGRRFLPTSAIHALGLLAITILVTLDLAAQERGSPPPGARESQDPTLAGPKYKPGEVLVRFRPAVGSAKQQAIHGLLRAQVARAYSRIPGLQLVRIPQTISVGDAIRRYRQNPDVLYAEPNYRVHIAEIPSDSAFGEQWALNNTGQNGGTPDADIDAPEAWNLSTGSHDVVVGVIDTGIDYTHPDLAANVFNNPLDCNANGIDDDGNGYTDDCHGIDTINGDSDPMDDSYHGTHVSGTIGAVGNSGLGVTGVNWNVTIIACKFLGADGFGYTSGVIACLDYLGMMKDRGVNLVATNNIGAATHSPRRCLMRLTRTASAGMAFQKRESLARRESRRGGSKKPQSFWKVKVCACIFRLSA